MRLTFPLLNRCALLLTLLLTSVLSCAAPYVRILEPRPEEILPGPDVTVRFATGGMCMAECGNSLHFMLDNEPFEVQHDPNHPHVFKDVRPGTHTIRVYLANRMHEAIRGTLAIVTFSVAYPDGENRPAYGAPLLTYNLPQGEYLGVDAGDIAVDYLVSNVRLAPGSNKVAYYVNGRRFFVTDGAPRHLKELPPGYHTIRMELQDANGDLIQGPFNSVERTILVSPDSTVGKTKLPETYPDTLPKISSIKGAMTVGRPWRVVEEPPVMTAEQIRESRRLTVRPSGAGTSVDAVDLDDEEVIAIEERTVPAVEPRTVTETRTVLVEEEDETEPAANGSQSSVRQETKTETVRDSGPATIAGELNAPSAAAATTAETPKRTKAAEAAPAAGATGTNTVTTTSSTHRTTTTSGPRRLDNRLERQPPRTTTATLRVDPPTTAGRARVRRDDETTGVRRAEKRNPDTTGTRRTERRDARRGERGTTEARMQQDRVRERNPQRLNRRNPNTGTQPAVSETAQ